MTYGKKYYASFAPKTWAGGLALCLRYNMDFVNFDSYAENENYLSLLNDDVYWIGVTDTVTEGTFKNYNGFETVSTSFIKWKAGEPNNYLGDEDCGTSMRVGNNDDQCDKYLRVVCERRIPIKPATQVITSKAPEPALDRLDLTTKSRKLNSKESLFPYLRFIILENSYNKYYLSKMNLDWSSSRTLCTHHDTSFVTFQTPNEAAYISTLNQVVWVGISDIAVEGTYTRYFDLDNPVGYFLNWLAGEPNNQNSNEDCVQIAGNGYTDKLCTTTVKSGCMSE